MQLPLSETIQREIADLAGRFGAPIVRTIPIRTEDFWNHQPSNRRTHEVCMVVRRPNGRLLVAAKTFYPTGVYRLMTGGVERGERVLDALLRETYEETGLDVIVRRLLAVISWCPMDGDPSPRFATFAFLLDEVGGTLGTVDPNERIAAYREITPAELPAIADYLDQLPDEHTAEISEETWHVWGCYRAIHHRVVWDALAEG